MAMALSVLSPCSSLLKADFCAVQLIQKHSPYDAAIWRHNIAKMYSNESEQQVRQMQLWIEDNCHFHQTVGVIGTEDEDRKLLIWDHGVFILPSNNKEASGAVLAIKVCPFYCGTTQGTVRWNGEIDLETNTWIELFADDNTIKTTHVNVANVCSEDNWSSPQVYITGCHVSFDGNYAIFAFRVYNFCAFDICFISQMSCSPCPGVGMARALKALFPGGNIIGVDNKEDLMTGMIDSSFSSFVDIEDVMDQHLAGDFSAMQRTQWDLAMHLLTESPHAMYIP
jgi:hypothetical protein